MKKNSIVLIVLIIIVSVLSGCQNNAQKTTQISTNWEAIVALIVAGAAFISSIIGTFMIYNRGKKDTYINIITSNRIQWAQKSQTLINTFINLTSINTYGEIYKGKERKEFFDELNTNRNEIFMHFNPYGKIDVSILNSICEVYKRIELLYLISDFMELDWEERKERIESFNNNNKFEYDSKNKTFKFFFDKKELLNSEALTITYKTYHQFTEEIETLHNKLMCDAQYYLKKEWERIKKEANSSFLYETKLDQNEIELKKFYNYSFNKLENQFAEYDNIKD